MHHNEDLKNPTKWHQKEALCPNQVKLYILVISEAINPNQVKLYILVLKEPIKRYQTWTWKLVLEEKKQIILWY